MALTDTSRAIGAVTAMLESRIRTRTGVPIVSIGKPHQFVRSGRQLVLFLYEIVHDPYLKNTPLDEGQKPPIWMVLKYILAAFDTEGFSDSRSAHEDLGAAIRAIYEDNLLQFDGLDADVVEALEDNPEELKITFDESSVDLLAKLMQGSDEQLRLAIAFQVRPVMIASVEPPDYSLLVGVDYTQTPVAPTPDYVGLDVIPSLGAFISEIEPKGFEADENTVEAEVITIRGTDLHLSNLAVHLGNVELPVTMQRPDELQFIVSPALVNGATISAGSHPVSLVQTLPSGKKRSSNMVVANLVPTLTTATIVSPVIVDPSNPQNVFATIDFDGSLLGDEDDDVIIAFYQDGKVIKMFDNSELLASPQPQTQRRLVIISPEGEVEVEPDPVPAGEYLLILRVNGQQAPQSPKVNLIP